MNRIITFYSYKGGVGRSMALANVGTLLSLWKYKTIIIDWDLEAPGLENFFKHSITDQDIQSRNGVIDILTSLNSDKNAKVKWQDCIIPISISDEATPIHLLTAGKRDEEYSRRLREFNVDKFYDDNQGGIKLEKFRKELLDNYDFVLIDSRTGVTDFGGICTIQLPDILVLFFTPTEQSLQGIKYVAKRAMEVQKKLPYDRQRLVSLPVPSRIDSQTEFRITQEWIERFSTELSDILDYWIPTAISKRSFIELVKIPYIPYFSYGEQLSVMIQGTSDPTGLGYAYENLASLLANNLQQAEIFLERRDEYINTAKRIHKEKTDSPEKINIYISYSSEDREIINKILTYLSVLKTTHNVNFWDDSQIMAGEDWRKSIQTRIRKSDIILFFISQNLLKSDLYNEEIEAARLHASHKAMIVPVLLNQTNFHGSVLERYQFLSLKQNNLVEKTPAGFLEITESLKDLIEYYKSDYRKFDINARKSKIEELVSSGNIDEALNELIDFSADFGKGNKHKTNAVILKSQYNLINKMDKGGTITSRDRLDQIRMLAESILILTETIANDTGIE